MSKNTKNILAQLAEGPVEETETEDEGVCSKCGQALPETAE